MMHTIAALAILAIAQDPAPAGSLVGTARVNRDGTASALLDLGAPLPNGAVLKVTTLLIRHRFDSRQDLLTADGSQDIVGLPTLVLIRDQKARTTILLPTPGLYEFHAAFEAGAQQDLRFKKLRAPGFTPLRITAGDADDLLRTLFDDAAVARRHVDACKAFFERLEKDAADPERTLALLKEIQKEQAACLKESGRTMMNAAFEFIAAVLGDLECARLYYEELVRQKKQRLGGDGSSDSTGDGPSDLHSSDKTGTAVSSGATGRPLSLDSLKALIDRADALRIRETLSWCARFALLPGASADTIAAGVKALAEDPSKERRERFASWDGGATDLAPLLKKGDVEGLKRAADSVSLKARGGKS